MFQPLQNSVIPEQTWVANGVEAYNTHSQMQENLKRFTAGFQALANHANLLGLSKKRRFA